MTGHAPISRYATTVASHDLGWKWRGACRDEDPELFWPVGSSVEAQMQTDDAKAVCRRCPMQEICLQYALDERQDSGVWGGLSEDERRAIHRRKRSSVDSTSARLPALERILTTQLDTLREAVSDELTPGEIARRLRTTAPIVKQALARLEERAKAGLGVAA